MWAEREPGGEHLAGTVVGDVHTWLGDRLDHLRVHGESPLPDGDEPCWAAVPGGRLPVRAGEPPEVTAAIPQHQRSRNAPAHLQAELWARLTALDAVSAAPATVGVAASSPRPTATPWRVRSSRPGFLRDHGAEDTVTSPTHGCAPPSGRRREPP